MHPVDYAILGAYVGGLFLFLLLSRLWGSHQRRAAALPPAESAGPLRSPSMSRSSRASSAATAVEEALDELDQEGQKVPGFPAAPTAAAVPAQTEADSFFLAHHSAGFLTVATAFFASNIGSDAIIGLTSGGAETGLAAAWFDLLSPLAFLALAFLFLPVYRLANVSTLPEYAEKRFGRGLRVYLSCLSLLLYITNKTAVALFCGRLLLQGFLPWNGYACIALLLGLTGSLTLVGGLGGIMQAEMANTALLLMGGLAVTAVSLTNIGGLQGLRQALQDGTAAAAAAIAEAGTGRNSSTGSSSSLLTTTITASLISTTAISSSPSSGPSWNGAAPSMGHLFQQQGRYSMLAVALGSPWLILWFHCCDQEMVQRGLAAKSLADGQLGCILAGFLKLAVPWMFAVPGLIARVLFSEQLGCSKVWVPSGDSAGGEGGAGGEGSGGMWQLAFLGDSSSSSSAEAPSSAAATAALHLPPDSGAASAAAAAISAGSWDCRGANQAFLLLMKLLPTGLLGIMLAASLAGVVSVLASTFNSASTLYALDIVKRLRPSTGPRTAVGCGKLWIVLMLALAVTWMPILDVLSPSLYLTMQELNAVVAPPIVSLFLAALFLPSVAGPAAAGAVFVGHALGIGRLLLSLLMPAAAAAAAAGEGEAGELAAASSAFQRTVLSAVGSNFLYFAAFQGAATLALMLLASWWSGWGSRMERRKEGRQGVREQAAGVVGGGRRRKLVVRRSSRLDAGAALTPQAGLLPALTASPLATASHHEALSVREMREREEGLSSAESSSRRRKSRSPGSSLLDQQQQQARPAALGEEDGEEGDEEAEQYLPAAFLVTASTSSESSGSSAFDDRTPGAASLLNTHSLGHRAQQSSFCLPAKEARSARARVAGGSGAGLAPAGWTRCRLWCTGGQRRRMSSQSSVEEEQALRLALSSALVAAREAAAAAATAAATEDSPPLPHECRHLLAEVAGALAAEDALLDGNTQQQASQQQNNDGEDATAEDEEDGGMQEGAALLQGPSSAAVSHIDTSLKLSCHPCLQSPFFQQREFVRLCSIATLLHPLAATASGGWHRKEQAAAAEALLKMIRAGAAAEVVAAAEVAAGAGLARCTPPPAGSPMSSSPPLSAALLNHAAQPADQSQTRQASALGLSLSAALTTGTAAAGAHNLTRQRQLGSRWLYHYLLQCSLEYAARLASNAGGQRRSWPPSMAERTAAISFFLHGAGTAAAPPASPFASAASASGAFSAVPGAEGSKAHSFLIPAAAVLLVATTAAFVGFLW